MFRRIIIRALSAAALGWVAAFAQESGPRTGSVIGTVGADHQVWKTITLGTHRNAYAMRAALDAVQVRVGDSANEILGRPDFRYSATKTDVDLVALSAAEIGFGQGAKLVDIYARAIRLGFELCPAEVGPELRRAYLDQPPGEVLHIAMAPIATYVGEPIDLTIANDGDGLLLIGGFGRSDLGLAASVRFVFVRPRGLGGRVAQETQ